MMIGVGANAMQRSIQIPAIAIDLPFPAPEFWFHRQYVGRQALKQNARDMILGNAPFGGLKGRLLFGLFFYVADGLRQVFA
jgi:hypothetical protein